jgi:hypothetical protein
MIALLLTLLLHRGWMQPHNPHRPSCAVVFHIGCASLNPPPTVVPHLPPPVLPGH